MNIVCIRILKSQSNFEQIIKTLTILDTLVSEDWYLNNRITSSSLYGKHLTKIFNIKSQHKMNDYVYNTINQYRKSKTSICINLDAFNTWVEDKTLLSLFLHHLVPMHWSEYHDMGVWIDYKRNLPKPQFLHFFTNLKHITINTTSDNGDHIYALSLRELVNIFAFYSHTSVQTVTIVANIRIPSQLVSSWLYSIWTNAINLRSWSIDNGFNIQFGSQIQQKNNVYCDYVKISRI